MAANGRFDTPRASQIIDAWWDGATADAEAAIAEHTGFSDSRSAILALAYGEYCVKEARGTPVDADAFCERFPRIRSSLFRRIEVHEFIDSHASFIAEEKPEWPQEGETVSGFRLLDKLGEGGLSRVFLAEQVELSNRTVIVKISNCKTAEAETIARLRHENIVPVYSTHLDKERGLHLSVMPFQSRHTLEDLFDEAYALRAPPRKLSTALRPLLSAYDEKDLDRLGLVELPGPPDAFYLDTVIDLIRQLAHALAHTHARGVLHLDIKPSNILFTPAGRPMLMDFNLSANQPAVKALLGGTLPYMAPEQIQAARFACGEDNGNGSPPEPAATEVDARSDVFGLGVVFYELLSGRHPYGLYSWSGDIPRSAEKLLSRQAVGPKPLPQAAGELDAELVDTVHQCLACDPEARFQSAEELADRCERLTRPSSRRRRRLQTDPQSRKQFIGRVVATALLVVSLALTSLALLPASRASRADAYFDSGVTLAEQGKHAEAYQVFRQSVGLEERAETYAWMGYCSAQNGDPAQALSDYREAQRLGLDTAAINVGIAHCHKQHANSGRAVRYLKRALARDAFLQEAYVMWAFLCVRQKEVTAAVECIDNAVALGELSPKAHQTAAYVYSKSDLAEPERTGLVSWHAKEALRGGMDPTKVWHSVSGCISPDKYKAITEDSPRQPPYLTVGYLIPYPPDRVRRR